MILQTERLVLREITHKDFHSLCKILQDIENMYAWEHEFSDSEVHEWIEKNLLRYKNDGYSYYAVLRKEDNEFIGVSGPLNENINDEKFIGIGYILRKEHTKKGYATEIVNAIMKYIFDNFETDTVVAQIRTNNVDSIKLAERLGMKPTFTYHKKYKGKDMPHIVYKKCSY